jgi:hypothetical protein
MGSLSYAFFVVLLVLYLASAAATAGAGYAHHALLARAHRYALASQPFAIANAQTQLATIVQSGNSTAVTAANLTATTAAATCTSIVGDSVCPFSVTSTFSLAGSTADGTNTADTTGSLDTYATIQATDVTVAVTTVVKNASSGEILATIKRNIVYTLSLASPYAYLSATTNAAGAGDAGGGPIAGGDAMNCDGTNATSCDSGATAAVDDTRIHALIECQTTGGSGQCGTGAGQTPNQDVTSANQAQDQWSQGTNQTGGGWSQ